MSFSADKKREHEKKAEGALRRTPRDYAAAYKHTARAAAYTYDLAEQSSGKLKRAYLDDADRLLKTAERLKERASVKELEDPEPQDIGNGQPGTDSRNEPSRWELTKKLNVSWDDVKGLHEAKQLIQDRVISPLKHPELMDLYKVRAGGGLLLYGPPGNGKTMFAKAIASEINAAFLNVSAKDLKNKYVGESEKAVSSMFTEARRHSPCVLFLDEAESILRKRGNQKIATVEQFLSESDGMEEHSSDNCLLLLLATNRPNLIDSAVLRSGRIGVHVYVGLPEEETRRAIIETQLETSPREDFDIEWLVDATKGFTCAEIGHETDGLCVIARTLAFRRAVGKAEEREDSSGDPDPGPVSRGDFEKALERKTPPYSERYAEEMERYRQWNPAGDAGENPGEGPSGDPGEDGDEE